MGGIPEDNSFLVYVSLRKGFAVGKSASDVIAIIHHPSGKTFKVPLLDDGSCKKIYMYTNYV